MKRYRIIKLAAFFDELKRMKERPIGVLLEDIRKLPAGKPNPKVPSAGLSRLPL